MSESADDRPSLLVLRQGPIARYMACETFSMVGSWMQTMAQGWMMATLSDSAFMLGLVNLAGSLPPFLLSMKGGTAADKFDKRMILLACQVGQIMLAVTAGLLIARGQLRIEHLIVLSALTGISTAFEMPAATALVPELVPKEHMAAAIALDRIVFHSTRILGPSAAGLAIGLWGSSSAFYANALSFIPMCICLFTLPRRPQGTPEEEELRGAGMKAGFDFVRNDAPTFAMIMLLSLSAFFVTPAVIVMMPLYARDALGLPAQGMGTLMSMAAVGSLLGTGLLLRIRKRQRLAAIAVATMGEAAALFGLSVATHVIAAGLALIVMTTGMSTLFGVSGTIIQERAPAALRGRVSAIAGLTFFGLVPLSGLLVTWLSDHMGMRYVLGTSAAIFLVSALVMLGGPGRRALEPRGAEG